MFVGKRRALSALVHVITIRACLKFIAIYCRNEESIEKAGVRPMVPFLSIADSISTNASMVHAVASLIRINGKPFFFWDAGADADSSEQVLYMQQGGLTLPDPSYYSSKDLSDKKEAMRSFVEKIMRMVGETEIGAQAAAEAVMRIETDLAAMHCEHRGPCSCIIPLAAAAAHAEGLIMHAFAIRYTYMYTVFALNVTRLSAREHASALTSVTVALCKQHRASPHHTPYSTHKQCV